ncbi:uncharacterized protein [Fopius arisanus]|uniref:Uncharacterized protein isoform X2 n=1 Tax=Fopius arisanus TaxID=64838 RepID=A0A9R1U6V0_9HYME|nr:PREDICTED: uncharacterized protein LOC105270279 isoform X2 [Fopius arisanus]
MTTNMRSVLRLSMALRNLSVSSSRVLSLRSVHSSSGLDARFNRSVSAEPFGHSQRALDDFDKPEKPKGYLRQLRTCDIPEEVLLLVKNENSGMQLIHALKTLEVLFDMSKKNSEKFEDIHEKKEFSILCEIVKKNIRQLEREQAIQALKYLTYLRVPSTTVIIQMLLQMIRTSVNQLSLDEIVFLSFLLQKCRKTPLVEALEIALPIVFETHVGHKLDPENLDSVVRVFQYLRKSNLNLDAITRILKIIEKTDTSKIKPPNAKQILFCLVELQLTDLVRSLIPRMMGILSEDIDTFNEEELQAMVRRLSDKFNDVKNNRDAYYHEGFADACAATVISRDLGFEVAQDLTHFYNDVGHVNIALLDYMSAKCFEDKRIISGANKYQIGSFFYALSQADYKPVFWDSIKESLMSEKLLDQNPGKLTKVGLYMASLDCLMPKLIEKVFTQFEVRSEGHTSAKKRFLLLYHAVKSGFHGYKGPWPSEDLLRGCENIPAVDREEYPLQDAIECALGGQQYVINQLKTKFGYYVDNVVIMRKGGFPIAINKEGHLVEKIEELIPLPDSQVLIFMNIPNYGHARNTDRLTGYWAFLIKQLESGTKSTVIPILSRTWKKLSEPERIRYISQAIRLKCDELSAVVN